MIPEAAVVRPGDSSSGTDEPDRTALSSLRLSVFGLFFIFGGITSLNDVLIPKLKELFVLSYAEAMLIQSAFFAAYFLISLPAAALVRRYGYMRGAVVGLLCMSVGCLLFIPAASTGLFVTFLGALFVLAAGITTVQVVANPLISMLGNPETAHSRLTFAQAFNSLGTTVFPYVGSLLILQSLTTMGAQSLSEAEHMAYRVRESHVIMEAYAGLAVVLTIVAALVWASRNSLREAPRESYSIRRAFNLLGQPRFAFGAACIFLYVGAEVAIGSVIVNFLQRADVMGLDELSAGKHLPYYWGGAMIGRFVGSWFLARYSPGKVLAFNSCAAILLVATSVSQTGALAGWALLSVGLFNSIMFPTIFSLACEGLGNRAAEGSGIICITIVGGAIIPPLTGLAADMFGLELALIVPALCYLGIMVFGYSARTPAHGNHARQAGGNSQ